MLCVFLKSKIINIMKILFTAVLSLLFFTATFAQNQNNSTTDNDVFVRPRLVVGIVVDQMRFDYLTRFYDRYGEGGFKRLMNSGFHFKNNHYNYVPTYTGPGHASVYTGTPPAVHGIISNDWYDKVSGSSVYCAYDEDVNPVGTESSAGKMSPHRMITTSIADELKIATQLQSKIIGIALKDRGAILPAGHAADAAYWFCGKDEGKWISSSYYMDELPEWVQDFNTSGIVESYIQEDWTLLYDISTYTQSGDDDAPYEKKFKGIEKSVFPYKLSELAADNGGFDILRTTPFGNNLTTDFAIAAIEGEQLGKDLITDFLAVSYSSPDYIGHHFGTNSKEIEDNYLRLDKDLERLFNYLDNNVGINQYTVFLTADHGAVHTPGFLQSAGIPTGFFDRRSFEADLKTRLAEIFGTEDIIENFSNNQIFINRNVARENKLQLSLIENTIADIILEHPQTDKVFTRSQLQNTHFTYGMGYLVQNGFHQKRSGDVMFTHIPAVISTWNQDGGTTHGSGYTYDTHVPLLFFGKGIKKGGTNNKSEIIDIAPTLSALLGISRPNGATGRVLTELFE